MVHGGDMLGVAHAGVVAELGEEAWPRVGGARWARAAWV
jgi:hypothetical protein